MYIKAMNILVFNLEEGNVLSRAYRQLTVQNILQIGWSRTTVNSVLLQGDKMYLDALNSGLIVLDEDVGFLSVGNLPKAVSASFSTSMFSYEILDYTEDSVSVNNTSHMLPAKTTQRTLVRER